MLSLLALLGCDSGTVPAGPPDSPTVAESTFALRWPHERAPLEDPLAVGAQLGVRLVVANPAGPDEVDPDPLELSVDDPSVARIDHGSVVAVAPGETVLRAVADVGGVRSSAERAIRVREVARREWRLEDEVLATDLLVLKGTQQSLHVHTYGPDGAHLLADGVPFDLPEHGTVEPASTPGFTLVTFRTLEPGRYPIPNTDIAIEVAPEFEWSVEGAVLTLSWQGRPLHVRSPTFAALDSCAVSPRAEGDNPFTLALRSPYSGPCRVQATLLGRTITFEATF
ncbi:MAG: hypothetical protein R3F61_37350 [Myxococcota bacterium]